MMLLISAQHNNRQRILNVSRNASAFMTQELLEYARWAIAGYLLHTTTDYGALRLDLAFGLHLGEGSSWSQSNQFISPNARMDSQM